MPTIDLRLDKDGCWPDIGAKHQAGLLRTSEDPIGMALLSDGTELGRPSVSIRIDLPDGQLVMVQTSLKVLALAVRAMETRLKVKTWGDMEGNQVILID
jgi:hypothetical protein